uniref:Secreted protein n=1 Tax=Plectus sambesii TaxID=2011161 RepID=A0A914WKZ4_9BILA
MIDLRLSLLVCMCAFAKAQDNKSEFPLWRTITGEGQDRPPSERFIGRSPGTRLLVYPNGVGSLPFHPFLPPVPFPDQPAGGSRYSNKLQYVWHPVHSYSTPSTSRHSVLRPSVTLPTPTTTGSKRLGR